MRNMMALALWNRENTFFFHQICASKYMSWIKIRQRKSDLSPVGAHVGRAAIFPSPYVWDGIRVFLVGTLCSRAHCCMTTRPPLHTLVDTINSDITSGRPLTTWAPVFKSHPTSSSFFIEASRPVDPAKRRKRSENAFHYRHLPTFFPKLRHSVYSKLAFTKIHCGKNAAWKQYLKNIFCVVTSLLALDTKKRCCLHCILMLSSWESEHIPALFWKAPHTCGQHMRGDAPLLARARVTEKSRRGPREWLNNTRDSVFERAAAVSAERWSSSCRDAVHLIRVIPSLENSFPDLMILGKSSLFIWKSILSIKINMWKCVEVSWFTDVLAHIWCGKSHSAALAISLHRYSAWFSIGYDRRSTTEGIIDCQLWKAQNVPATASTRGRVMVMIEQRSIHRLTTFDLDISNCCPCKLTALLHYLVLH